MQQRVCVIGLRFACVLLMCAWAFLVGPVYAQQSEAALSTPSNFLLSKRYCPAVETLVLDESRNWSAPGGWKSTSSSILKTLTDFVGAQWVGVGVGEVLCVYAKSDRANFPVALQARGLVPLPKHGSWGQNQGGHVECKSHNVSDCPFYVEVPVAPANVYDEIDFYKGLPVEQE